MTTNREPDGFELTKAFSIGTALRELGTHDKRLLELADKLDENLRHLRPAFRSSPAIEGAEPIGWVDDDMIDWLKTAPNNGSCNLWKRDDTGAYYEGRYTRTPVYLHPPATKSQCNEDERVMEPVIDRGDLQDRADFEAWASVELTDELDKNENGDYLFDLANGGWRAWQARAVTATASPVQVDEAAVIAYMREQIGPGTQQDYAVRIGYSPQYLYDVLKGSRSVSDGLANAVGFKRVVTFQRVES